MLRDSASNSLTSLVSVDGATIDQTALPTQLLPRCVNSNLEEARAGNFKTGAGEVVVVKTPNTVYEAVYAGGRERRVTANTCGFAAINSTSTISWEDSANQAFSIGGTSYNVTNSANYPMATVQVDGEVINPNDCSFGRKRHL